MGISFLSWNVEKFKAINVARIRTVAEHIRSHDPDVFCILEFKGKSSSSDPSKEKGAARKLISEFFPDYDFGLSDSKQRIEILIGCRRNSFAQILYTQRREFRAGNLSLRPGGLLSVREKSNSFFYNFLFLHTDSGTSEKEYKNRLYMFRKIWKLKKALQELPLQAGKARLMAMGDLNTMGHDGYGNVKPISEDKEIAALKKKAKVHGMKVLRKSFDKTWSRPSGSMKSNLDHVIASDDLEFQKWYYASNPNDEFEVEVRGWNDRPKNTQKWFIENISDHCSIYGEIV